MQFGILIRLNTLSLYNLAPVILDTGNPLQYSCLENSMDRGVWRATVYGVTESDMTE